MICRYNDAKIVSVKRSSHWKEVKPESCLFEVKPKSRLIEVKPVKPKMKLNLNHV